MARRYYDPRDDERRFLRDEDRRYGRRRDEDDDDLDVREMRYAYGRYSGSEQAEDRRRLEGGRVGGARYRHGEGSRGGGMERHRESPYPMGYGAADPARGRAMRDVEPGRYRGVGPKGYTRPDERVREDVCDRLSEDAWLDASDIEVAVRDGEVTLGGTVGSRDDKRHAEDLAERALGVRNVQNNLRVGQSSGGPYAGSTVGQTTQRH